MNLRGIANGAINAVHSDETVTVLRSTGFTIGAGSKQIPTYDAPIVGPANIQAMGFADLRQVEGLNLQGELRAIYFHGNLAGVIRPDGTGGDLVKRGFPVQTWKVAKVLESWETWTKACIVRQMDSP